MADHERLNRPASFHPRLRWRFRALLRALSRTLLRAFFRALPVLAVLLLTALPPSARAETIPAIENTDGWLVGWFPQWLPFVGSFMDPMAVCQEYAEQHSSGRGSYTNLQLEAVSDTAYVCRFMGWDARWVADAIYKMAYCPATGRQGRAGTVEGQYACTVYTCPDDTWTLDGQTCTRPDQPVCEAGDNLLDGVYLTGDGSPPSLNSGICYNGCVYPVSGRSVGYSGDSVSHWIVTVGAGSGDSCTASGSFVPVLPNSPEYECVSQGKIPGTVNGQVICVDSGNGTTEPSEPTEPGTGGTGPGTGSGDDGEGGDGGDGDGTGGTGPGTGGTEPGTGSGDGEDGGEDDEESETSFSGVCGAEPVCQGDAVQCAQAREAWKLHCALTQEPDDPAYTLGKSIAAGNDPGLPNNPLDPSNIDAIDVAQIVSQAAGERTLTASCIPPQTFTMLGASYTFDTTMLCEFAEIVGQLMVAVASILAVRMITSA